MTFLNGNNAMLTANVSVRITTVVLLLVLSYTNANGQRRPDSLILNANFLIEQADFQLVKNNRDSAIFYLKLASQKFHKIQNWGSLIYTLVETGNVFFQLKKYDETVKVLNKAIDLGKLRNIENEDIAFAFHTRGNVHFRKNEIDRALVDFQKALNLRIEILGEVHIETGKTLGNIAIIYSNHYGDWLKGLEYGLRALENKEMHEDENSLRIFNSVNGVAMDYFNIGDFENGMQYALRAISIAEYLYRNEPSFNNTKLLAGVYNNLALHFTELRMLERAKEFHEKSMALTRSIEDERGEARHYQNVGRMYWRQGDYMRAKLYYKKSIDISLTQDPPFAYVLANSYTGMGACFHYLENDFEEAINYFKKAKKLKQELFHANHPLIAVEYGNMALSYIELGEYQNALNHFNVSKKINELNDLHLDFGQDRNIAYLYRLKKDFSGAEKILIPGINRMASSKNYYQKIQHYLALSECYYEWNKLDLALQSIKRGRYIVKMAQSRIGSQFSRQLIELLNLEANVELKEYENNPSFYGYRHLLNVLTKYERAIELQQINASLYKGQESKKIMLNNSMGLYENAIGTSFYLYVLSGKNEYLDKIFGLMEQSKSVLLRETIAAKNAKKFFEMPHDWLQKESILNGQLSYLEKKLHDLMSLENTDSTIFFQLTSKVDSLQIAIFDFNEKTEELYPKYHQLKFSYETISLKKVQNLLISNNSSMLEFFIGTTNIFILHISKDEILVKKVVKDFPLEEWINSFRRTMDKNNFQNSIKEYGWVAHQLYRKLIKPISENLKMELIIIPDGLMGYLPFETLLVEPVEKTYRFRNHHYLVEDLQISYSYSATLLQEMREKQHEQEVSKEFLGFAPYYEGDTIALNQMFRVVNPEDKQPFHALPNTGEEVYSIQKLIGGDVFYKEQATEDQFVNLAGDYRILHLATHGRADDTSGDYSFLAFTEQKDSIENELLFVRDLYNLQLNADMVVLSACETGIGELQKGEGIISLARGMTYAGAKSIITSLWSVEDESTKDIMLDFYGNLKKGMTKDAALRKAKLDFIHNENNGHVDVHPFYWSGFIGIGDMSALNMN